MLTMLTYAAGTCIGGLVRDEHAPMIYIHIIYIIYIYIYIIIYIVNMRGAVRRVFVKSV